jgi:hypothetical protein
VLISAQVTFPPNGITGLVVAPVGAEGGDDRQAAAALVVLASHLGHRGLGDPVAHDQPDLGDIGAEGLPR